MFVITASAIGRISLWLKGGDPVILIGSGFLLEFTLECFNRGQE